jgi:hypothetical protein
MTVSNKPNPLFVRFLGGNLFFSVGCLGAFVMTVDEVATCAVTFALGTDVDPDKPPLLLLLTLDDAGAPGCLATDDWGLCDGTADVFVLAVLANELAGISTTFFACMGAEEAETPVAGAGRAVEPDLATGWTAG